MDELQGMNVAILVADGFEQVEMTDPRRALDHAGARTVLISPAEGGQVRGWDHTDWGARFGVEETLDQARVESYDALLLPGGVMNPDKLRGNPKAVAFVKAFVDRGLPIAAICHGPWTVLEAGAAKGRRMTSWPSLKSDLKNAGADWVDAEVVESDGLVTSRKPDDIPAFEREMIRLFARDRQARAGNAAA
jgi:protease I